MSDLSIVEFAGRLAAERNGDGLGNLARHLRDSTGEMFLRLAEFTEDMPPELKDSFRVLLREVLCAPGAPFFETNTRTFECLQQSAAPDQELVRLINRRVRVAVT